MAVTQVFRNSVGARLDLEVLLLVGVTAEGAGVGELAELVPDHVFRAVHVDELAAVVHLEGVADEFRDNRARAGPCLDGNALVACLELLNLAVHALDDVWTLLERS